MAIKLDMDADDFRARIERKTKAMRKAVQIASANTQAILKNEITRRYRAGTGSHSLKSRSGRLMGNTFTSSKIDKDLGVKLSVYNDIEYAAIHEYGGIIRPKKKYLTIPTKHVKGGAASRPRTISDFPDGFFKRRGGNLFFAVGHGRTLRVLFVLVRKVRMPSRPIWRKTFKSKHGEVLRQWDAVGEVVANA